MNGFDTSIFTPATTPRVIGGNPSPINSYPWFTDLDGCGGILVSPFFVLTAAHCWSLIIPNDRVEIGHFCNSPNNCGQVREQTNVIRKYVHPQYTWSSDSPSNDFMLLRLNQKSKITPVAFDNGSYSTNYVTGKKLWVVGGGVVDLATGQSATKLKHAEIEYMASNQCNARYINKITPSMMCAGFPGRDSCQGDSGGPLYDKENNIVVGLTSWGYECADPIYPGVYARIADQTDWIQGIICAETPEGNVLPSFCTLSSTTSPSPTLAPTVCTGTVASATIRTDFFPYETSWEIRDIQSGEVVVGDGGFVEKYATFQKETCLRDDVCYRFKLSDADGDGINLEDAYDLVIDGKDISLPGPFNQGKEFILFGDCTSCKPTTIMLDITTDGHAGETSWTISNATTGEQVYKGGFGTPYKDFKDYTILMNLCHGCYAFRMYDTFGDGLDPPASYTLHDGDQVFSGGIFDHSDSIQFGNCTSTCEDNELEVKLDIDVWGDGTEISWRITEEDTSRVAASGSHDSSTNRLFCLERNCYDFLSVNSGEMDDAYGISNFEYSLTVDGEVVVAQDPFGGNYKFGCGIRSEPNASQAPSAWGATIISFSLIFASLILMP
jgi:trypsin